MHITFVYNSKCAGTIINQLLSNAGLSKLEKLRPSLKNQNQEYTERKSKS